MFMLEIYAPSGDPIDVYGPFETNEEAAKWFDDHFSRWPELDMNVVEEKTYKNSLCPIIAIETDDLPF